MASVIPASSLVPSGLSSAVSNPGGTLSSIVGSATLLNADTNPDELGQLNQLVLKASVDDPGIAFPGVLFREERQKALAIHEYPNTDLAAVENMGEHAQRYAVKAILTNNIYPNKNETWKPGTLFPYIFNNLINMLQDAGDKVFQHPLYGNLTVQVEGWSYELNPHGPRDGAIVEIHFVQTREEGSSLLLQLSPDKGSNIISTANALDASIASLLPPSLNIPNLQLNQFFGKIGAIINSCIAFPSNFVAELNDDIVAPISIGTFGIVSSLIKAPFYTANSVVSTVNGLKSVVLGGTVPTAAEYDENTVNAFKSITTLNNTPSQNASQLFNKVQRTLIDVERHYIAQNNIACAPVIANLRKLLKQVQDVQSSLSINTSNTQHTKVAIYMTTSNITWGSLSKILNNRIDQLMLLNQALVDDFWIPANTNVSYYQA